MEFLKDDRTIFYSTILLAAILLNLKKTGKYLSILNTLIHETGHAFTTLILKGRVRKIELFSNAGGTTSSESRGVASVILIPLSGYFFSSAMGFLFFYLISHNHHKPVLFILSGIAAINLMVLVRNRYGIFWIISFLAIVSSAFLIKNADYSYLLSLFLSSVIFIKAFSSSFKPLLISFSNVKQSGDAYVLQKSTGVPAFFWGLIFASQALIFAIATIFIFFPH